MMSFVETPNLQEMKTFGMAYSIVAINGLLVAQECLRGISSSHALALLGACGDETSLANHGGGHLTKSQVKSHVHTKSGVICVRVTHVYLCALAAGSGRHFEET